MYMTEQKKQNNIDIFKKNLVRLRKERGLSQRALAAKIGVTQRLITYYEKEAPNIPLTKIQEIAEALEVSIVELLDPRQRISNTEELDVRTIRKIKQIESLPRRARDALWHTINATLDKYAEKSRTTKKASDNE